MGRFPRVTHPSAAGTRRCPLDLHVLSLPPAFVLSQDQTLKFCKTLIWLIWSRMNRREHSHPDAKPPPPGHPNHPQGNNQDKPAAGNQSVPVDYILTKRDPPKSRSNVPDPQKDQPPKGPTGQDRNPAPERNIQQALCRPRFSFFNIQFSKNRRQSHDRRR